MLYIFVHVDYNPTKFLSHIFFNKSNIESSYIINWWMKAVGFLVLLNNKADNSFLHWYQLSYKLV